MTEACANRTPTKVISTPVAAVVTGPSMTN